MYPQTDTQGNTAIRRKQIANMLQPFLDGLFEPVLIVAMDGKILQINAAAAQAFGCEPEVLLRASVQELISGLTGELLQEIVTSTRWKRILLEGAQCSLAGQGNFVARISVSAIVVEAQNRLCFCLNNAATEADFAAAQAQIAELTARAGALENCLGSVAETVAILSQPVQSLMSMAGLDENEPYKQEMHRVAQTMVILQKQLNLSPAQAAEPAAGDAPALAAALSGLVPTRPNRLLIADDEKPVRESFQNTITRAFPGLEIDLASDGHRATELFQQRHHAIILLDLLMPGMNGEQVFSVISEFCVKSDWQMPSVLFCTGFSVPEALRQRIKEDRIHGVVPKPTNRTDLLKAIEECLAFHQPAGQAAEPAAQTGQ